MGNLLHAGAAPRCPEVHERVFVGRVVDHRGQGNDLPVGIALHDVHVGLADVYQISKDTDLYRLYNTNIHEKIAEQKKREMQKNVE